MPETESGLLHVRTDASAQLPICKEQFSSLKGEVTRTNNALFGPDGTDGMMARQLTMETKLNTIYKIITYLVTPGMVITIIIQAWELMKR